MSLEGIVSKAWSSVSVPGRRPDGTMIMEAERQLLYYVASEYFADEGHIIDTGCLLGGSTLALGHGLKVWQSRAGRAPTHRIHAYDLFTAQDWMFDSHISRDAYTRGQDLQPEFRKNIEAVAEFVEVHAGDIKQKTRPEGPIEILFVDVAKSPELSDFVVREFFPALIPGRSIVIQQDYLYDLEVSAWLHVTMEYYADYFRILTDTTRNSVAFLYEREIPKDRLVDRTLGKLGALEKLDLMARARRRFSGAEADLMLRAQYHYVLGEYWRGDDAAGHRAARAGAELMLAAQKSLAGGDNSVGEMVKLAARYSALEARLKWIEESSSWRLTAPVRAVGHALQAMGLRRPRALRASP